VKDIENRKCEMTTRRNERLKKCRVRDELERTLWSEGWDVRESDGCNRARERVRSRGMREVG
jgi:hypothetical protein